MTFVALGASVVQSSPTLYSITAPPRLAFADTAWLSPSYTSDTFTPVTVYPVVFVYISKSPFTTVTA